MLKNMAKLGGILCAIALVTALLLALTNELTKDIIANHLVEKKNEAMAQVIQADKYVPASNEPGVYELYLAEKKDGTVVGYTVSLSEYGYAGEIDMMIGVTLDGTVSGVSITDMSETPGLGDNAKKPEFTNMFKGLSKNDIAIQKEGGKIQALSGATVTSKAVVRGVNRAVDIVLNTVDGGTKK